MTSHSSRTVTNEPLCSFVRLQISRPISSNIPYDIYAHIIASLDFEALCAFSLVCRDFKHEANKYLWCIFTLNAPARPLENEFWAREYVKEGCNVLLKDGRAERVRELKLDFEASLGADTNEEEFVGTLELILEVLKRARRLRCLSIKSLHHRARLANMLSTGDSVVKLSSQSSTTCPPFVFKLERFTTDLFCDTHLYGFWRCQAPSIRHVELLAVDSRPGHEPPSLPHPLPQLKSLRATLSQHTDILQHSPVTAVELSGIWEGDCDAIRENLCAVQKATLELLARPINHLLDASEPDEDYSRKVLGSHKYGGSTSRGRRRRALGTITNQNHHSHHHYPYHHYNHHHHIPYHSPSPHHMHIPHPLILGPAILSLHLTLFDIPTSSHAYTSLIAHLPHLRLLNITHSDIPTFNDQRRLALNVLASLRELEVFEWAGGSGPAAQADVFAVLSGKCRALRGICFRWGNGNWFEKRFERESELAGWGIVQS